MPKSRSKTPRPYLSWSQYTLWNEDRAEYIRRYFEGKESPETPAMAFGKRIAEGLDGEDGEDVEVEHLRTFLPNFGKREVKLKANFGGVPLYAIMDGFDGRRLHIHELKTGRQPWTEARVRKWGQRLFYALTVFAKRDKIPGFTLHWARTDYAEDGELHLTGQIKSFPAPVTLPELLAFGGSVMRTWQEIKAFSKTYSHESQ